MCNIFVILDIMAGYSSKLNRPSFFSKFTLISIIILLLILTSEAGFLAYNQLSEKNNLPKIILKGATSTPISPAPLDLELKHFAWGYKGWLESMGFNENFLPGIQTSFTIQGRVEKAIRLDPNANDDYIGFQLLVVTPSEQKVLINLSEYQEVPDAQVVVFKDNKRVDSDLSEIKADDNVVVYFDINYLGKEPRTYYTIEVAK